METLRPESSDHHGRQRHQREQGRKSNPEIGGPADRGQGRIIGKRQGAETGDGGQGRQQHRPSGLDEAHLSILRVTGLNPVPDVQTVVAPHADDRHQHHGIHEIEPHTAQRHDPQHGQ